MWISFMYQLTIIAGFSTGQNVEQMQTIQILLAYSTVGVAYKFSI